MIKVGSRIRIKKDMLNRFGAWSSDVNHQWTHDLILTVKANGQCYHPVTNQPAMVLNGYEDYYELADYFERELVTARLP